MTSVIIPYFFRAYLIIALLLTPFAHHNAMDTVSADYCLPDPSQYDIQAPQKSLAITSAHCPLCLNLDTPAFYPSNTSHGLGLLKARDKRPTQASKLVRLESLTNAYDARAPPLMS